MSASSSPRSSRRDALVLAGVVLVGLANFGLWRARPRLAELDALAAEEAELSGKRARLAGALRGSAGPLQREVAALRDEQERLGAALAERAARLAAPEEAGDLEVTLSALARECGLRLESAKAARAAPAPAGDAAPDLTNLGAFLAAGPAARPLQDWHLRGGFDGLWRFLARLEALPWQVVVLRLEVERSDGPARGRAPLGIRLTVAL